MPPNLQIVQQWLEKVKADLGVAEMTVDADPTLSAAAGFHCQRAVEKSLKGYLIVNDVDFEYVHDIKYLLELCIPRDAAFERFGPLAESLNSYAVSFRYPSSRPEPTPNQAREAQAAAREVFGFVLDRLPVQTHPGT